MTQTASCIQAKATVAMRRVESYQKRFGDAHIYLACYAALPLALTPDLLYRLWANFQRDAQGELLEIPWIAVSDLLLSNLCEEVGEELYEMEDGVREVLLDQLRSLPQLGEARLKEVAEFVLAYVEPQLNNPDLDVRDLAEMQQWRSLAYVEPEAAARSIALRLAELDHGDKSEWLRMARLVEPLAEPLVEFGALVDYTRGMAAFVRGRREEAISQLQRALGDKPEVEVAGVRLPLPEGLRSLLQSEIPRIESQPSWVDFLLRNRRWVGAGAGLLVMMGSGVYWWRSPRSAEDVVRRPEPSVSPSIPIASPVTLPSSNVSPSALSSPSVSPSASPSPSSPAAITSPSNSPTATPSATASPETGLFFPRPTAGNSPSSVASPSPSPSVSTSSNATPTVTETSSAAVSAVVSNTPSPTSLPSPQISTSPAASPTPSSQPNQTANLPPQVLLDVPYFNQRANRNNPDGSNGVTAMAMVLTYYGVKPTGNLSLADEIYEKMINQGLSRHDPYDLVALMQQYGFTSNFNNKSSWPEIKQALAKGYPVLVHGYFAAFGHIVCIVGYNSDGFIVNDSWGKWEPSRERVPRTIDYKLSAFGGYDPVVGYNLNSTDQNDARGYRVVYSYKSMDEVVSPDVELWAHIITPLNSPWK